MRFVPELGKSKSQAAYRFLHQKRKKKKKNNKIQSPRFTTTKKYIYGFFLKKNFYDDNKTIYSDMYTCKQFYCSLLMNFYRFFLLFFLSFEEKNKQIVSRIWRTNWAFSFVVDYFRNSFGRGHFGIFIFQFLYSFYSFFVSNIFPRFSIFFFSFLLKCGLLCVLFCLCHILGVYVFAIFSYSFFFQFVGSVE